MQSSDPEFTALLRSGERSWIDIPFQAGESRLFITSMLFEEPGFRPEWHYLALMIGKDEWKRIASHRRLLRMLERYSKSGWRELFRKDSENMELVAEETGENHLLPKELPRYLFSREQEALDKLEDACLFSDDASFAEDKIAWNPAALNSGWKCIIATKKRIGLKEESFVFPWESRLSRRECVTGTKSEEPCPKIQKKKLNRKRLLMLALLIVVCCALALVCFLKVKSEPSYSPDLHIPSLMIERFDETDPSALHSGPYAPEKKDSSGEEIAFEALMEGREDEQYK